MRLLAKVYLISRNILTKVQSKACDYKLVCVATSGAVLYRFSALDSCLSNDMQESEVGFLIFRVSPACSDLSIGCTRKCDCCTGPCLSNSWVLDCPTLVVPVTYRSFTSFLATKKREVQLVLSSVFKRTIVDLTDLANATGIFAKSAAMLANCEEHTSLSRALSQLAETEEKIDLLYQEQGTADYYVLAELLRDYVGLLGTVKVITYFRSAIAS